MQFGENILNQDPLFVDPDEDDFRLQNESPCIDAGDPDSPLDPDSTIADIGPFFFSQPNIGLSVDSLAFEETPVDSWDTLSFVIRNRGDQHDLRFFIDEEAMDRAFILLEWEGDTATISAGESVEYRLLFHPDSAREYIDTLRIWSNDRDQRWIKIPLHGMTSNGIEDCRLKIEDWGISPPFPNPFNDEVRIGFTLPETRFVTLAIYDLSGKIVVEQTGKMESGLHQEIWKADAFAAGVYFLKVTAGNDVKTAKLLLVK